jgi:hypothetical protein
MCHHVKTPEITCKNFSGKLTSHHVSQGYYLQRLTEICVGTVLTTHFEFVNRYT